MGEKILSTFNAQQVMEQSGWNFKRPWKGSVDVSVWLRIKAESGARIFLVLQYRDKESHRAIPIDRCLGGAQNVLLNGRVNLAGSGCIEQFAVKLRFEGVVKAVAVDELTVKFPGSNQAVRQMQLAV